MLANLWQVFVDLSNKRQSGYGISPITYTEIKNYIDLTDTILAPQEVKAIKRLDASYIRIMNSAKYV